MYSSRALTLPLCVLFALLGVTVGRSVVDYPFGIDVSANGLGTCEPGMNECAPDYITTVKLMKKRHGDLTPFGRVMFATMIQCFIQKSEEECNVAECSWEGDYCEGQDNEDFEKFMTDCFEGGTSPACQPLLASMACGMQADEAACATTDGCAWTESDGCGTTIEFVLGAMSTEGSKLNKNMKAALAKCRQLPFPACSAAQAYSTSRPFSMGLVRLLNAQRPHQYRPDFASKND